MTRGSGSPMRSVLFVPADRADMIAKVTRTRPDVVVLDLEDGVAFDRKDVARAGIAAAVDVVRASGPGCDVYVRVNAPDTPWFAEDVRCTVDDVGIVLPKCESADHVAAACGDRAAPRVMAGIESARGVLHAAGIAAAPHVTAVYFGAEDYMADVGGRRTAGGLEVLYARSHVVAACRAAGVAPIDQVHVAVHDDAGFLQQCQDALTMGFAGKLCIHPRQVELVHQAFKPSPDELDAALRVLQAHQAAADAGSGVSVVDGRMIDEPLVRQARAVRDRATAN